MIGIRNSWNKNGQRNLCHVHTQCGHEGLCSRKEIGCPPVGFSKENSLALKGIGILMMIWHHCFVAGLSGRLDGYSINFWPLQAIQVVNIADFCKICVSMFAFVSGYGLFLSYQRDWRKKKQGRWVYERLVHTLSGYWFILILSWIVCTLLDNRPYQVYGFGDSVFSGIWNALIEFLGLTNLTGGIVASQQTGGAWLNTNWWYISAAIAFIILSPLIYEGFERIGCFCSLGVILIFPRISMGYPGMASFYSFLPIFCLGMIFAKNDLFAKWDQYWKEKGTAAKIGRFLLMLVSLVGVYKLSYFMPEWNWWDVKWNLFPVAVIFFARDFIFWLPIVGSILKFLGKHATNIFLIHAFIYYYYCMDFLYSIGHFLWIMVSLLLISLAISIAVEKLKQLIHYEKLLTLIFKIE